MAAYAALAFLSFLWGSSFLLIKIASRAFDPFDFALARVAIAAAAMLLTSALHPRRERMRGEGAVHGEKP